MCVCAEPEDVTSRLIFSATYHRDDFGAEPAFWQCAVFRGNRGRRVKIVVKTQVMGRGKRILLPLLFVLPLIPCGFLTKVVLQQKRTIASQHMLIQLLHKDNLMLKNAWQKSTARASERENASSVQGKAAAPSSKIPMIQVPAEQVPSEKASSEKIPSTQVPSGKTGTKTGRKSGKAQKLPNRPPAELTDPTDMRRVSVAI
jgi:hypothetical protein